MAVKALCAVVGVEPDANLTYKVKLNIWDNANNVVVVNDAAFPSSSLASTVNASLRDFVEAYIQEEWAVEFNPLTDSVKLVNPISLL
jgi:hypothetical protein